MFSEFEIYWFRTIDIVDNDHCIWAKVDDDDEKDDFTDDDDDKDDLGDDEDDKDDDSNDGDDDEDESIGKRYPVELPVKESGQMSGQIT